MTAQGEHANCTHHGGDRSLGHMGVKPVLTATPPLHVFHMCFFSLLHRGDDATLYENF